MQQLAKKQEIKEIQVLPFDPIKKASSIVSVTSVQDMQYGLSINTMASTHRYINRHGKISLDVITQYFGSEYNDEIYPELNEKLSMILIAESKKVTKATIAIIIGKYLSMTGKAKNISKDMISILVDYLMVHCNNLELQEIDFIFKNGILGKFGTIYDEIYLDTITGDKGWIERYYSDYRNLRQEPYSQNIIDLSKLNKDQLIEYRKSNNNSIKDYELTGKEISYDEFLKSNPDIVRNDAHIKILAKSGNISMDLIKRHFGDQFDDLFNQFSTKYQEYKKRHAELVIMLSEILSDDDKVKALLEKRMIENNVGKDQNIQNQIFNIQTKIDLDYDEIQKEIKELKSNILNSEIEFIKNSFIKKILSNG